MENTYLYHVIYHTIKLNPGITLNQLVWIVNRDIGTDTATLKLLVRDLMKGTGNLVRCINYFTIPKEKTRKGYEVVHLRCRDKNKEETETIFSKFREEHGYKLPELTFKKVTTNAPLQKI
jgi:hypothetical protein